MSAPTCKEWIYGGKLGSGPCGRPRKDDPDNPGDLCGLHLAAKRRRSAKVEERRAERTAQQEILDRVNAQIAKLDRWGVTATAHYYTGKVVVDPDELLLVLRELDLMTDPAKLSD